MPSRRRLLILALILLLVGGAVNVAVSWGIAATRYPMGRTPDDTPLPRWHVPLRPQIGSEQAQYVLVGRGVVFVKQAALEFEIGGPSFSPRTARSAATGWPMLSLATTWLTDRRERPVRSSLWKQGIELPAWLEEEHELFDLTDAHLPVRPALPGFVINTLFYAALLALPLSFFPIRRWRRQRCGRCGRCNYDLTGIGGPCPECGARRSTR